MANLLLQRQCADPNNSPFSFKFALFFASCDLGDPVYKTEQKVDVPSIHFMGKTDAIVSMERGQKLVELYNNSKTSHTFGPILLSSIAAMNKYRVLCLHGYRQDALKLRGRIAALRRTFKSSVEFVCLDAPFEVPYEPTSEEHTNNGETGENVSQLKWCDFTRDEETGQYLLSQVEEAIDYVANFVKKEGPFDGIFGFSQGGSMASMILQRQGAGCHSSVSMVLLRVFLAVFFFLWGFNRPIRADTVLIVTPENEASLTLAAELYRTAQATDQSQDKERLLRESIDAYPEIAAAYNNLAMLIFERQERDEALQLLERGLQAAEATQDWENMANIHNNLGFITRERGKWSVAYSLEALQHFEKALEISPEFVGALYNKASVLLALRRDMESKEQLLKVLELEPDDRQAHLDLGRIYFEHGDLEKALEHEDYVIKVATTAKEKLQGMHNKGVFLKEYNLLSRALEVYDAMLTIESVESYVLIDMMNAKRSFCDWKGMEKLENQVLVAAQRQFEFEMPQEPVVFLPFDSTLLKVSDVFRKKLAIRASKRLKIGYLSFDFRDHPMGHLTLGLIEQHAALARGVDTICYSYGPNSVASAPWRRQFEEKCDVFRDLLGMSDLQAAQTIGLDGIDVLVDLMAHTKGARLGIPSLRPSRIVVNYLGYPGTMGSSFTDFVMVDKMVLPPEVAAASMTEQVVYLPHTYQANRYEPWIPSCGVDTECQRANRSQHGLPTDVLVFCNFNTINKMESESFAVWMSILRQVPKSVLWLLAPSGPDAPRVMEKLHDQAMRHGVLPSRVIFAPRVDKYSHLARITVADIFLDSFVYNAHSTAADALWANVPIVTLWGDTFPSRVAASLILNALPFPELVSHSVRDYERKAVYLAKKPKVLRRIRNALASYTLTSPLFNTKQTTETIETAPQSRRCILLPRVRPGMVGKWGPTSLNSGLGGSEEAVVFLSRELQKLGYWVEIYGDPSPQDISTLDQADEDNVRWYPHYTYDINDKGVDIFVAWRYHISMAMGRAARKKFLWMHDLPQEDARRSPELLNNADGIFCLSEFHAAVFPEILQSKITVSTNAVDRSFFVNGPNHADRFVYGSSPSRGLYPLLKAWPRIREKIPTAELSVFYGFTPAFMKWGNSEMTNFTEWMNEMNRLVTETPETSCISLMKAMANGAIPITSRFPLSALPETVDDFDLGPRALQHHAIDDDPEWLELWIQSIVDARTMSNKQPLYVTA
ncbi:O-GlcNAc transferase, C-terminal [Phytophthora cactorum]|nr:O-GlcNAc transferase, C-terminal [Phytophthora cactorum]